jgi:hypothetical protein
MKKQISLILILLFTTFQIHAQIENIKFAQVAKQVDLMIEHYQSVAKRHIELMNQPNRGDLSEIKSLMDEWKTIEEADKIQLKTIFRNYGFLGYSYEPKPVIDVQNLNKRRAEVGLATIEEAVMLMNRHFAASLKK